MSSGFAFRGDAVQQRVPASSTAARHVKYPDSRSDIGAFAGSRDIGSFRQLFDGAFQGSSVYACLLCSKVLGRPAQDDPVVGFGRSGEGELASDDGRSPGAAVSIAICYRLRGQTSQVITQRFECLEAPKVPCVDVGDAGGSGLAQRA